MGTKADRIRIDEEGRTPVSEMNGPLIDLDEHTQEWLGVCPHHGEIRRAENTVLGHDQAVWAIVQHWAMEHGDDGLIPLEMLMHLANEAHEGSHEP